jgi:hypothetical protein
MIVLAELSSVRYGEFNQCPAEEERLVFYIQTEEADLNLWSELQVII